MPSVQPEAVRYCAPLLPFLDEFSRREVGQLEKVGIPNIVGARDGGISHPRQQLIRSPINRASFNS